MRPAAPLRRSLDLFDRIRHLPELDSDIAVRNGDECPLGERTQDGRILEPVVRDPDAAGVEVERVLDSARPLQVRVPTCPQRGIVAEERLDRLAVELGSRTSS